MKLTFDAFSIINSIGLGYSIILAFLFLIKRKGNKSANIILAFFIFNSFLCCFFVILYNTNLYYYLPYLIGINQPPMFLLGPLVFFYVRSLLKIEFKKIDMLHFLPFFIYTIFMIPEYFQNNHDKINNVYNVLNHGAADNFFIIIVLPIILIQIIAYLTVIFMRIKIHESNLKQSYSSIEKINLAWIKHFITVFGIVSVILIPIFFLVPMGVKFSDISNFLPISVSFATFLIGYNAWIQPEIFFETEFNVENESYKIKEIAAIDETSVIYNYFRDKKPYLNQHLTLKDLSDDLNMTEKMLSSIIDTSIKKSFIDFVNYHRVEEAKEILINTDDMDYAAASSGFESKNYFNRVFKDFTGMSPLEFKSEYSKKGNAVSLLTMGVFYDNFYDPYENTIITGIIECAREYNIGLLFFNGGSLKAPQHIPTQKNEVFNLASLKSLDGLLMISSCLVNYITEEELSEFYKSYDKIPILSIGLALEDYPCITINNYDGMYKLMIHLIEIHKYKKFLFMRGPENNFDSNIRFEAYKSALSKYSIPINDKNILSGAFHGDVGKEIIRLIDNGKTDYDAIIASNDLAAVQIIHELNYRNIKVPDDIAVIGFDNIIEGRYMPKPLTTVSQPEFFLGYLAVKNLMSSIRHNLTINNIDIPSIPVIRDTCGCYNFYNYGKSYISSKTTTKNLSKLKSYISSGITGLINKIFPEQIDGRSKSEWISILVDSYMEDLNHLKIKKFKDAFNKILSALIKEYNNFVLCNDEILKILDHASEYVSSEKEKLFLNELLSRIKESIYNIGKKHNEYPLIENKENEFSLLLIVQAIANIFDMERLKEAIVSGFPKLGIISCYISLYEDISEPLKKSKIIIGYKNNKIIDYRSNEEIFPTADLIPGGMKNISSENVFIVTSLAGKQKSIGFVIIECKKSEQIYEKLVIQLSSTMESIRLYDNLKKQIELNRQMVKKSTKKYQYINLSKEKSKELFRNLLEIMEKQAVYKDPELTLPELAKQMEVPRTYLSYIINEYAGLNFFDFVNTYRVEEAKRLFIASKNKNIIDIAYESGFNSKSTFNKLFKKCSNKTPSDYKKEIIRQKQFN